MRGLHLADLDLRQGTVVVESQPPLSPSPGLRTVRIYPVDDLAHLPAQLQGWTGRLQGLALAGSAAWSLEPRLQELGISRSAEPGELQLVDACWRNGGHDPLESFL